MTPSAGGTGDVTLNSHGQDVGQPAGDIGSAGRAAAGGQVGNPPQPAAGASAPTPCTPSPAGGTPPRPVPREVPSEATAAETEADAAKRAAAEGVTKAASREFIYADQTAFDDIEAFRRLKADIAANGLKNPVIEYVEIDGEKYIVRGNQRVSVAETLGIQDKLIFKKVELPFLGYRNANDVTDGVE